MILTVSFMDLVRIFAAGFVLGAIALALLGYRSKK